MGFFDRFRRKSSKKDKKIQPKIITDFSPFSLIQTMSSGSSFACIDRIASEFASLNYNVYDAKTNQKVKKHAIYELLRMPNLEDGHFNFFYQSAVDYYNGGVFWYKAKMHGEVVSLFRMNPASVAIDRNIETNRRYYRYNGKEYTDDEVIYIPSRFGYSTVRGGQSVFDSAKSVFSVADNLDSYALATFSNGVMGKRVVIDVSKAFPDLTSEQAQLIKDNFQSEYAGPENASRPLLQKDGINYTELGSNTDNKGVELSENRKYQEHEIAKVFGVPEGLLNVSKDTNLENVFTVFSEFAIRPLATQFQEAINELLEDGYYFEFDYNGIMKVSLQQRIDAYTKQINNGLLSPNEARLKENLPPIEAGENHFMPVNLMPLNDETINAYMAKQKQTINESNPTDEDSQHFLGGDDKV